MKYKDIIIESHHNELLRRAAILYFAIIWDGGKYVKIKNKELNSFHTFDFSEYEKKYPQNKVFKQLKDANPETCIKRILYFEDFGNSKTFKISQLKENLSFLDGWTRGRFSINPGFTLFRL